jgi:transposase
MTTGTRASTSVGFCPFCDGVLTWNDRSWTCENCRFVPNHGAD